ncbi:MAG: enoyl-ACP reductase [Bacteroidetes bacterium GWE2_29_8]|nr:MAG: enoyl-ACP reductase [Bacteroidetes bacterium GWE2_29_8]OFY16605.1 MAG: enoyl-ACP reductase [Bacteroidetes bacterium GWF2_29_10]
MNYNLLKDKKGIIFGALDSNSIAWKVAERCHEEGASLILSNNRLALRLGEIYKLSEKINASVIPADVSDVSDIENLMAEAKKEFGGIDFILHSVGMSPNVRKNIPYPEIKYDNFVKTLDVSAISFHKILQVAWDMDILNERASVLALSYIAAQKTFASYSDMAQAKALLESIARSFGYHYGLRKGVRINTISQSPTKTTAGSGVKGFSAFYNYANAMSPIGNADADDCADVCVMMFSDLSKKITMQNLFVDGGFSSMGISEKLFEFYLEKDK